MKHLSLAAAAALALASPAFGGDCYVSTQGNDANDGLTPETALLTVGEAVERANRSYGSRITVLPGTYSFPGTREWTFGAERGEGLTVYQVAAMKPDIL